jgi:hypothetical protein
MNYFIRASKRSYIMENIPQNKEVFPFSLNETMMAMEIMYFLAIGEFVLKS